MMVKAKGPVWHKKQLLFLVSVAHYEEASALLGRDAKQLHQNAANVLDVVANRGFPSKLAVDAVVLMAEIRGRRDGQVYAVGGQPAEHCFGIAADDPMVLQHGFFLEGRLTSLSRKAVILARRRSSRNGPIWHSQITITCQPLFRNSR